MRQEEVEEVTTEIELHEKGCKFGDAAKRCAMSWHKEASDLVEYRKNQSRRR